MHKWELKGIRRPFVFIRIYFQASDVWFQARLRLLSPAELLKHSWSPRGRQKPQLRKGSVRHPKHKRGRFNPKFPFDPLPLTSRACTDPTSPAGGCRGILKSTSLAVNFKPDKAHSWPGSNKCLHWKTTITSRMFPPLLEGLEPQFTSHKVGLITAETSQGTSSSGRSRWTNAGKVLNVVPGALSFTSPTKICPKICTLKRRQLTQEPDLTMIRTGKH